MEQLRTPVPRYGLADARGGSKDGGLVSAPSISVVVPAYNAAEWITETLESVLSQSALPDEVIVVDDGSTDDTAEQAARVDPFVRVIRQENRGAPGAYNRGFAEASSDCVAMCPADDRWQPEKIEWQRSVLRDNPDVDIVFGGAEFFGCRTGGFPRPPTSGRLARADFLPELYQRCLIPAPTAVVRRRLHEQLGRFREDIAIEDYEFWLRALTGGAVFYFDERLLVMLRQHETNLGSSNALLVWELNLRIHEWYADAIKDKSLVARVIAADLAAIGRCQLGLGDVRAARASYRGSMRRRFTLGTLPPAALAHAPGAGALLSRLRPAAQAHLTAPEKASG